MPAGPGPGGRPPPCGHRPRVPRRRGARPGPVALRRRPDRRDRLSGARPRHPADRYRQRDLRLRRRTPAGRTSTTRDGSRSPRRRSDARRANRPARVQLVPHRASRFRRRSAARSRPGRPSCSRWCRRLRRGLGRRTAHASLGQSGGTWSAASTPPTALVLTGDARPGQEIQLAVFGINGPLSNPPGELHLGPHRPRLDFYPATGADRITPAEVNVTVVREDPALDAIVGPNPKVWKLADGFQFTEGPVWVPATSGYLLFCDPNATPSTVGARGPGLGLPEPSGYTGADIAEYGQPGSNGLTLDPEGRITIDQHGNRRVDPPREGRQGYGPGRPVRGQAAEQPQRSRIPVRRHALLHRSSVRTARSSSTTRARSSRSPACTRCRRKARCGSSTTELTGPNGIAFSPDEKLLYVGDWDEKKKVVMRYQPTRRRASGRARCSST